MPDKCIIFQFLQVPACSYSCVCTCAKLFCIILLIKFLKEWHLCMHFCRLIYNVAVISVSLPSSSTACRPEGDTEGTSDKLLAGDLELSGTSVEGVDFKFFPAGGAVLIPPPVTFLGGAMATILTGPRGSDLTMVSASVNFFPSRLSSLMEMR